MRRFTRPMSSNTLMCLETAFKDMLKGAATSVTRASPRARCSMIALRVGSAIAPNTASNRTLCALRLLAETRFSFLTVVAVRIKSINHKVDGEVKSRVTGEYCLLDAFQILDDKQAG